MTKTQFAEFIQHFSFTRVHGGEYEVPREVILACFDTWVEDGTLDPLYDYEDAIDDETHPLHSGGREP